MQYRSKARPVEMEDGRELVMLQTSSRNRADGTK
jgi:hypothetical protein